MANTKKDIPPLSMAEQFKGLPIESLIGGLPQDGDTDKPPAEPKDPNQPPDAGLLDDPWIRKPVRP